MEDFLLFFSWAKYENVSTYLDLGKEDFLGESPLTDEVWGVPAIRYPPYLDILLMYISTYVYFHPDIEKSVQ